jgi:hypothetical protein
MNAVPATNILKKMFFLVRENARIFRKCAYCIFAKFSQNFAVFDKICAKIPENFRKTSTGNRQFLIFYEELVDIIFPNF